MMAYPEIAIIGYTSQRASFSPQQSQGTKGYSNSLDSYNHSKHFIRKIALHYDHLCIIKYL